MKKYTYKSHRPLFSRPASQAQSRPSRRWVILPRVWGGLKRVAMVMGFAMLFNMLIMLLILPLAFNQDDTPNLPNEFVLYLPFEGGFHETAEAGSVLDPFAKPPLTVRQLVDALDKAAEDDRVKGVLARMKSGGFSLSHVQEVRAAVKRFRASGKFAHIYSSSFGDGGNGLGRYYLASAFDEIWMQPLGVVMIPGVSAEMPFLRGVLDKVGVRPQFYQRKEYKTAYENLTEKSLSRYNRETMQQIVDDIRAEIMADIPEERGIPAATFATLVNKGLLTAPEAEEAGLVTRADYGDILLDDIAEQIAGKRDVDALSIVPVARYVAGTKGKAHDGNSVLSKNKRTVALIHVSGAIMYDDEGGALGGGEVAAANTIAPAILAASKDEDVKAIVLRVNSPGGSPAASESILRAVEKAKEQGKTVIVSMGPVAASGGYWVSAYADRIFVTPATLTGSIGVVGGKFSIAELSKKIGVNWESVSWGENSDMFSMSEPFDRVGAERMNAMLDNVYDNFLERVAKGRGMDVAEVDKIAGGRVWMGRKAVEIGLADEIGGLQDALDFAAGAVGLESRKDLDIRIFPVPKTPLQKLLELLEGQAMAGKAVRAQYEALKVFQPVLETLQIRSAEPVSAYEAMRLE